MNGTNIFGNFTVWTAAGLLLALALTTFWHELGHYVVARLFRVPVKLIAFGVGPALWRRPAPGDVRIEVRALPLGMAVGVVGRRTSDGHARRPVSHDIMVAVGGPLFSFVLSEMLIFAAIALAPLFPFTPPHPVQLWLIGTALLSSVLGVMNLIPMPGLDGGHLAMLFLATLGLQFTPQREVAVMRLGVRLTGVICLLAGLFALLRR